ncbi:Hypothetical protein CINCED_3A008763 [Cinara cedri]|uniref:Uncharacterized protein n=1 Tax=Cinara cedri TaxID=506608 RepID=A0A5E4NLM9_9HEMI|nr:Hypothetical protein CINCED_3A008763 [Cinara cedri]
MFLNTYVAEIRLAGFASGNAKKNFDVLRKQFGEEIPSNSNGKIPSQGVLKRKLPPINFEVYGYADSYAMYLLIHYQFINDGINGLLDGIRWCNEKLGVGTETEEEISSPYQNMGNQSPYQNMGNQSPYQNMGNPFPYQNMGSPSPYKNMGNPSPYQNMENSPNYHPGYPLNNQIGGKPPSIKVPNKDTVNQPTHQMGYQGNYQNPRMVPSQYNMKNQDGYHNY